MSGHGVTDHGALAIIGYALAGDLEFASEEFAVQVSLAAVRSSLEQRAAELYTALSHALFHYVGRVLGTDLTGRDLPYSGVQATDYDLKPLPEDHPDHRMKILAGTIAVSAWNGHGITLERQITLAQAEGLLVEVAHEIAYSLFAAWAELAIRAEFPELHSS